MTDGRAGRPPSPRSGFAALAAAQDGPQRLAQIRLNAGIHNINAELAATPEQREIGLMFRTSMPAGDGMLFVFERPSKQCFWMKNTLIPLSVAFLGRRRQRRQHRRHEAADARRPLLDEAGALRPRDERRLVRQARHQGRQPPARRALRLLVGAPARSVAPTAGVGDARGERDSAEVLGGEVPVRERAHEGLGPLRPLVAVVDVVGVLPDVDRQQRRVAGRERRSGGAHVADVDAAVGLLDEPRPARAEVADRALGERFLERRDSRPTCS